MNTSVANSTYLDAQRRQIPSIYGKLVTDWLQLETNDRVLEIGSGGGSVIDAVRKVTPGAVASDTDASYLVQTGKQPAIELDATKMALASDSFDKTFSIHVLEHITHLEFVFAELARVTRPGGQTFHAFPRAPIRGLDGSLFDALRITKNPIRAFSMARTFHVHSLNPKKICRFAKTPGWVLTRAKAFFVREEFGFSWCVLLENRKR